MNDPRELPIAKGPADEILLVAVVIRNGNKYAELVKIQGATISVNTKGETVLVV